MSSGIKKVLQAAAPPAFWLGVWQLAALAVGRELLPGPRSVGARLLALAGTADFWLSVGATLGRVLLGLGWGALAGTALAFLTHFSPWANRLIAPAVRVVRATPVVSFILLVYLWVDRSAIPWVIAGLMVLPVVWGALSTGLDSLDKKLLELARAYRFSREKTLGLVYLPALRPHIEAGLLTAFGLAWKSGVAAEVLCLPSPALGGQIYYSKYYLNIPELFAWTAVAVALSLLLERLLSRLLARWGRGWGG